MQSYEGWARFANRDVPLVSPSAGYGFSVSGKSGIVSVFGGMVSVMSVVSFMFSHIQVLH